MPSMVYTFLDEKYMGARSIREELYGWDAYPERMCLTAAYYLYAALVARGAFRDEDPLRYARAGDVLPFHVRTGLWHARRG